MRPVAPRQLEVLRVIHAYRVQYDYAPTLREIAEAMHLASPAGVSQHLTALQRKGLVVHRAGRQRAISLTPAGLQLVVPHDNVCEHGDHPAPAGQRFCSRACAECELTEHDAERFECVGVCQRKEGEAE